MPVTNKLTPELEELIVSLRLLPNGGRKSTRQISADLKERGHDISHVTVSKVLKGHIGELREKSRDIAFTAMEGSIPKDVAITNELLDGVMKIWRKGQPEITPEGLKTCMQIRDWNGLTKQAISIVALRMELVGITGDTQKRDLGDYSDEELDTRLAQLEAIAYEGHQ